jgi:uncharacterized protein YjiS (DUF1127 family)
MTYVEKGHLIGRHDTSSAQTPEHGGAMRIALAILGWPLRAWRRKREFEQFESLSREQLRDVGLTPADVMAARCAPFHVGASIALADLAERRRRSAAQAADSDTSNNAPVKQENGQ